MIENKAFRKLNTTKSPDPYGENLAFTLWLLEQTKDKTITTNKDLDSLTFDYYLYQQQIDPEIADEELKTKFLKDKETYNKYNNELKARFNESLKFYNTFKLDEKGKVVDAVKTHNYASESLTIVCNKNSSKVSNFEEDDKFLTSQEAAELKIANGALMNCLYNPDSKFKAPSNLDVQDLFIAKILYTEENKKKRTSMKDCIEKAYKKGKKEKLEIINNHFGSYLDFVAFCKKFNIIKSNKTKKEFSGKIDIKNSSIKFLGFSKDGKNILLEVIDHNKLQKGTSIDQLKGIASKFLTQEMYKKYNGKKENLDKAIWDEYPEFEGIQAKTITEALPMLLLEQYLGISADTHYKHTVLVDKMEVKSENESRILKTIQIGDDFLITNTKYDETNKIRSTALGLQSDGLYFKYNPNTGKYIAFVSEPAAYEDLIKFLEKEIWNSSNSDHLLFNLFPMGLNNIERFHIISSGPIDAKKDLDKIKDYIKTHYQSSTNFFNIKLSIDFVPNQNIDQKAKIIAGKNWEEIDKYLNESRAFFTQNYVRYNEWKENPKKFEENHIKKYNDIPELDVFFFKLYAKCGEDDYVFQKIAPLFPEYRNKNAKRKELYDGCYGDGEFEKLRNDLNINENTTSEKYNLDCKALSKCIAELSGKKTNSIKKAKRK